MNNCNLEMRDAFIKNIHKKAKLNSDILFVSNEYGAPSLDAFREELSLQFVNAGISEQNIMSISAGLSLMGKRVFVYSIASFITLRCYEQIKIDVCQMNLPITIVGVGTCYAYAVDGPTHHATEDVAVMRALENISIYTPSDPLMAEALVDVALDAKGPVYLRFDKGKYPVLYSDISELHYGYAIRKEGGDICIITSGTMVHSAIEAAKRLDKESLKTAVVEITRLKPLNKRAIVEIIKKTQRVVTLEEHTLNGGIGSIIAELMVDSSIRRPVKRIGISDGKLYAYGLRDNLRLQRGLTSDQIVTNIANWCV